MSTQEQEGPRFGDKQFDAESANPGDVAYLDGSQPALVVSVNRAEEGDDVAVTYFPLTNLQTAHSQDFASENVDESGATPVGMATTGAPPTGPIAAPVIAATQPPTDDPARQTTPTGAAVGGGSAAPAAGAAQAASQGAVTSTNPPPGGATVPDASNIGNVTEPTDMGSAREAEQEARIAELERQLRQERGLADSPHPPDQGTGILGADVRPGGDEGGGPSGSGPAS